MKRQASKGTEKGVCNKRQRPAHCKQEEDTEVCTMLNSSSSRQRQLPAHRTQEESTEKSSVRNKRKRKLPVDCSQEERRYRERCPEQATTKAHHSEKYLHSEEWPRPTPKKARGYSCVTDDDSEAGLDGIRNARPSSQRPHRHKGGVKARRLHRRDVRRSSSGTEDSGGRQPPSRRHRRGRARSASYARDRRRKY